MKKLTLIITISALIFTSFFISCKKEEMLNQTISNLEPTKDGIKEPQKIGCEIFTTIYKPEDGEYCNKPGNNCAPCVTVRPNQKSSSLDCLYALVGASTNDLAKFFNNEDNYREMLPYLLSDEYSDFLKAVRSGDYYFSKSIKTDKGSNVIFVATNGNNRKELAFPIGIIQ